MCLAKSLVTVILKIGKSRKRFFLTIACQTIVLTFTQNDLNKGWVRIGPKKKENFFLELYKIAIYFLSKINLFFKNLTLMFFLKINQSKFHSKTFGKLLLQIPTKIKCLLPEYVK